MAYWIGAGGAVLFVLVLLVEGLVRPGYSPVRHPVSALALGPRGWIQAFNFVLSGMAISIGGIGVMIAAQHRLLGGILLAFGLAVITSGAFAMDPMRGYPPGTPEGDPSTTSFHHRVHDHAGAVVFLALPVAAVAAALTMQGAGWRILAGLAAPVLFLGSGAFGRAWERDSPRTGLAQRGYIIPGWLWVAVMFTHFALT